MAKKPKIKKKDSTSAPQGVTLGDLLGKKLETVKRDSEKKQKEMVKEARNNPAVQRSSEKFAVSAAKKVAPKPKAASKARPAAK